MDVPSAEEVADRIAALCGALRRFGYERAILFGSAARGDVHEGSDLTGWQRVEQRSSRAFTASFPTRRP